MFPCLRLGEDTCWHKSGVAQAIAYATPAGRKQFLKQKRSTLDIVLACRRWSRVGVACGRGCWLVVLVRSGFWPPRIGRVGATARPRGFGIVTSALMVVKRCGSQAEVDTEASVVRQRRSCVSAPRRRHVLRDRCGSSRGFSVRQEDPLGRTSFQNPPWRPPPSPRIYEGGESADARLAAPCPSDG